MEDIFEYLAKIMRTGFPLLGMKVPDDADIAPAEPITKPETRPDQRPAEDDPFYFPAPKVDPTPKGFIFYFKSSL